MEDQSNTPQKAAKPRRWILGGLAAATIAAFGAAAAWHGTSHAHGGMMGRGFGHGMHGPMDPEAMGRRIDAMVQWMLADVDATADQRSRIAAIAKAAANDLAPLRTKHQEARRRTAELLSAPTIDRAQIEAVRVEQMQLGDTVTRRMTQALADAAEVLDPAQRAKLVEKWQNRRGHRRG
jgi:Spy/CpxP family protein refolding chaperone